MLKVRKSAEKNRVMFVMSVRSTASLILECCSDAT